MEKNIRPTGLKGSAVINRMRELMNINESTKETGNSVVELTKLGPDGRAYAIVRENHEYFIKVSDKTSGLVAEDFHYIGGLQNKKDYAYPSYSKATKQLNLKFISLYETYGGERTDVLKDDGLMLEHHPYKADQALSATKGMGDGQEYVVDKKGKDLSYDSKEDKETSGDNVADNEFEDVKLSENEAAIDVMITGESLDPVGKEDEDVDNDGDSDETDDYLKNRRLKISKAIQNEENEDKLNDLIESLSEAEIKNLVEGLKKKV